MPQSASLNDWDAVMLTPLKNPDDVAFPNVTLPPGKVTFLGMIVVFVFEYSFAILIRESPDISPTEYKQTATKKQRNKQEAERGGG